MTDHKRVVIFMTQTRLTFAGIMGLLPAASAAFGQMPGTKDFFPQPPAGQIWKMIWHDEFLMDYVRVFDLVDEK